MEVRKIDNTVVRQKQVDRIQKTKAARDEAAAQAALAALTTCAQTKEGNLLECAVAAAKVRCTVGEISDALEKVYGRHTAGTSSVSGVYLSEYTNTSSAKAQEELTKCALPSGLPIRARAGKGRGGPLQRSCVSPPPPPPPPPLNGTGNSPSLRRPTPGVVKQDKSSGGSVDTTKTRSGPQRVGMCNGERPIGAAKGKQSDTEALCQPPPPPFKA